METKYIKKTYPITGITCGGCVASIEKTLKSLEFVSDAQVNFASHTVNINYKEGTTHSQLKLPLQNLGFDIIIKDSAKDSSDLQEKHFTKSLKEIKQRAIWTSIISIPIFIFGMFMENFVLGKWISFFLSILVIFWFGKSYFISTWKLIKKRTTNMDTLVAMSTSIAFVFSSFSLFFPDIWLEKGLQPHVYFEAASLIITFITLGKYLEEKAKSNTNKALKALINLQPTTVNIIENGTESIIDLEDVTPKMSIKIKAGEHIPVDGVLISGHSFVDESMLTGEPIPVEKSKMQTVYAGTVNQKGSFIIRSTSDGSTTRLSQIIQRVKEAQGSKAPVQKTVDKIASIFVPTILILATLTFVLWLTIGGFKFLNHGILSAVSVLVIACPCALGLATPTAIMVGMALGAKNQILIKDAESLEIGNQIDTVVFDKTGTLTVGKPKVTDSYYPDEQLFKAKKNALYLIENESTHPLSDSVVNYITKPKLLAQRLSSFNTIIGQGVEGTVNNENYYIGNLKLLESKDITFSNEDKKQYQRFTEEAKTVVCFADKSQVLAIFAIEDELKPSAVKAVKQLQSQNINVLILSGDHKIVVEKIAKKCNINGFRAEQTPENKANFIKNLQSKGHKVAMVGDGINDTQALALSDLSIAIGHGSDIAIDIAKVTLMSTNLSSVSKALSLSKFTVNGIRQNLFWAFVYNIIGIPIAAGALYYFTGFLLNPMVASAAMALSSVSVVLNSLRLNSKKL